MKYEHRNGESEPPAILGNYWFQGIHLDRPDDEIKEMVTFHEITNDVGKSWLSVWIPSLGSFECGYSADMSDLSGKWWGPFFAPWEEAAGDR